ncbi:hypothetical protein SAMN06295879_2069 [Agreia bicolorata]|uniref:Uncharacterized protein n=1 Tax=Agreia bicolorata TaxID=110935 RepID=A0A1T4Y1M9_9MICO|nr:hypothetical protein [Agreia bicolorata]SKA95714.1 hypothetical protein SAMN06295879_2069 [Agreia bicolorata]
MNQLPEEQHHNGDLAASDRGALIGSIVSGVFGVAWSFWGSSGLPHFAALCAQLAATLLGLVLIIAAVKRLTRIAKVSDSPSRRQTLFSSRAYVIIVVAEVLAIFGGNVVLTVTGQDQFRIVLVSAIVGVHFLVFGRLFWSGFYWLGAAMLATATAGTIVGLSTDYANLILVITGFGSAASLFVAAIPPLRRNTPTPPAS